MTLTFNPGFGEQFTGKQAGNRDTKKPADVNHIGGLSKSAMKPKKITQRPSLPFCLFLLRLLDLFLYLRRL